MSVSCSLLAAPDSTSYNYVPSVPFYYITLCCLLHKLYTIPPFKLGLAGYRFLKPRSQSATPPPPPTFLSMASGKRESYGYLSSATSLSAFASLRTFFNHPLAINLRSLRSDRIYSPLLDLLALWLETGHHHGPTSFPREFRIVGRR